MRLRLRLRGIAGLVVLSLAAPAGAFDKEQTHAEMLHLAAQIRALRAAGGSFASLQARYDQLRAALGGDDPGRLLSVRRRLRLAPPVDPRAPQATPPLPPNCMMAERTF